jgi:hypothetical protein
MGMPVRGGAEDCRGQGMACGGSAEVAGLSGEMADLRIQHEDAVADAKEAGEKLLSLVEHARKD